MVFLGEIFRDAFVDLQQLAFQLSNQGTRVSSELAHLLLDLLQCGAGPDLLGPEGFADDDALQQLLVHYLLLIVELSRFLAVGDDFADHLQLQVGVV